MRKVLWLALREYRTAVQTKGFVIGLALAPLLMGGSVIAMVLLEGHVDTTDKVVAVVDRSGAVAEALIEAAESRNAAEVYDETTGKKIRPAYLIVSIRPDEEHPAAQRLELSNRVRNNELHAFIEIGRGVLHPMEDSGASRVTYYAENAALDDLRRIRLVELGIDRAVANELFAWLPVEGRGLLTVDSETGDIKDAPRSHEGEAVGIPIVMMLLMFLLVMMGAVPMLNAVMEEKSQRIAEVLLGSVRPFEFLMGKLLGGLGVSLTGSAVYILGGVFAVRQLGLAEHVPYHILPWFFTYLVINIIMLGAIFAALGSTCNDAKEAQSISFPAMIPVMIPMFVLVPVLKEPMSSFATWLSLFPPFTPMLMLLRQSTPVGVPAWQPWVGLIGALVLTIAAVWAGGLIFRVGILMQGQPPRIGNLVRWTLSG
jgi:ABC-2 type transport system permease protein